MSFPEPSTRSTEIDYIIKKALTSTIEHQDIERKCNKRVHLLRAVFIAIDMTESMHIRDIKPSRLGVTIDMMRKLIKNMRDVTPLCKFMIAKVENELCKPLNNFTYNQNQLIDLLDGLRIHNGGFFSLENTLSVALDYFDSVPNTFHKELIIIQSSPFTKDYRDIFETISNFEKSRVSISIASLVGWTHVFQKLVESCHGRYATIGSLKEFEDFIHETANNPVYNEDKVLKKQIKMSLARREVAPEKSGKMCFCHYENVQEYFVCGVCSAVLCERMPMECAVCMTILVFPSDLYRHKY